MINNIFFYMSFQAVGDGVYAVVGIMWGLGCSLVWWDMLSRFCAVIETLIYM